jgi:CRISPR-associated endonuclease/helicase Cas3
VLGPSPQEECGTRWFTDFFPRAGLIYPNHGNLWRTARFLRSNPELRFPDDSRRALESVYGEQSLAVPVGLQQNTQKAEGENLSQAAMAVWNALNLHEGYKRTQSQWVDDTVSPTRLGEPTVTFRLGRLSGGSIIPWHHDSTDAKSWGLSEIRLLAYRLIDAGPPENEAERSARDAAIEQMPDGGKFSVLLPMKRIDDRLWQGQGLDSRGAPVRVIYDLARGLLFEE